MIYVYIHIYDIYIYLCIIVRTTKTNPTCRLVPDSVPTLGLRFMGTMG